MAAELPVVADDGAVAEPTSVQDTGNILTTTKHHTHIYEDF